MFPAPFFFFLDINFPEGTILRSPIIYGFLVRGQILPPLRLISFGMNFACCHTFGMQQTPYKPIGQSPLVIYKLLYWICINSGGGFLAAKLWYAAHCYRNFWQTTVNFLRGPRKLKETLNLVKYITTEEHHLGLVPSIRS